MECQRRATPQGFNDVDLHWIQRCYHACGALSSPFSMRAIWRPWPLCVRQNPSTPCPSAQCPLGIVCTHTDDTPGILVGRMGNHRRECRCQDFFSSLSSCNGLSTASMRRPPRLVRMETFLPVMRSCTVIMRLKRRQNLGSFIIPLCSI